jgi:hypothetical protein
VTISNLLDGSNEILAATTGATSITASYNTNNGVLTLSGSDTVANYQTVLRTVTYNNTAGSPAPAPRVISFVASDGTNNSLTNTSTVHIDSPPSLVNTAGALGYTENDPATAIDTSIIVDDFDDTQMLSATIAITGNFVNSEDILSFTHFSNITSNYNASTGVLILSGADTLANYQTALRSVQYSNSSDAPSIAPRTISYTITDNDGSSNTITQNINITAVNDLPDVTASVTALAYAENDSAIALDNALTITDLDNTTLTSATIQITNNYINGEDILTFTNTFGITGSFNTTNGMLTLTGTTTVANYQAAIRTITYANSSNDPSTATRTITFLVTDADTGTSFAGTRNIIITPVNDVPDLTTFVPTLAYTENDGAILLDNTLTITDLDDTNLTSASIQITANYVNTEDSLAFTNTTNITGNFNATNGMLTLTGTDTIANYQAALRTITYTNISDNPSTNTRTVTFFVTDATNGTSVAETLDMTITPVNDAPSITASIYDAPSLASTGSTVNYIENDAPTAIDSNITLNINNNLNITTITSATITITSNFASSEDTLAFTNTNTINGNYNATSGILTLTGADTYSNYQAALRSITYHNTSNSPSTLTRTLAFIVTDDHFNSNTLNRDITVTPVNDGPSIDANGINDSGLHFNTHFNVIASNPITLLGTDATISDAENNTITNATITVTNRLNGTSEILAATNTGNITSSYNTTTGVLTLTGTDTAANYQTVLRSITYDNTATTPNGTQRLITITASDGTTTGLQTTVGVTFSQFSVSSLNGTNGVIFNGSTAGFQAGEYVNFIGDINGDGIIDLMMGTDNSSNTHYIIFGQLNYTSPFAISTLNGTNGFLFNASANFFSIFSAAGDLNNDGYDDFIVGDESLNRAHVVFGNSTFSTPLAYTSLNGSNGFSINADDNTGIGVSYAGDFNGDGIDDIVVGDQAADVTGDNNQGQVYILFGKTSAFSALENLKTLNGTNGVIVQGEANNRQMGERVYSAGDINGDGFDDILIYQDYGSASANATTDAIVIFGGNTITSPLVTSALNGSNGFIIPGWGASRTGNFMGHADINGDGLDDLLIGARNADTNGTDAGKAFVIYGQTSGFSSAFDLNTLNGTNGFSINGLNAGEELGASISGVGDFNGDGYEDFLIGTVDSSFGDAYLIFGKAGSFGSSFDLNTLDGHNGIWLQGAVNADEFGEFIATSTGDVNGDGFDDLLISSARADPNGADSGASYLIYGYNASNNPTHMGTTGNDTFVGDTTNKNYMLGNAGNDTLIGGNADDVLIGGQGNDILDGGAGNNVLIGGDGDDILVYSAINILRVDGGAGMDTLRFDGSDQVFDLPTLNNTEYYKLYTNIEVINLGNNTNNQLIIDDMSLFRMTDSPRTMTTKAGNTHHNIMRVDGAGAVTLEGTWTNNGTLVIASDNYTEYQNGNAFIQIQDTSIVLTSTPVIDLNSLSIAGTNTTASFTEGDGAILISNSKLFVGDADGTLTSATVTITNLQNGANESLAATTGATNITASYNAINGTLTLSGADTVAHYQTVLRTITYNNTATSPNTTTRDIAFSVSDGTHTSNTATSNVSVAIATPFVLSDLAYTENGGAVAVDFSLLVTDADNSSLASATVQITNNYINGEDILAFTNTANITGSFNASNGMLTLTGTDTLANYQAALRTVTYTNNSDNPSIATRTITFITTDSSSDSSTPESRDITITPVNDAPNIANLDGDSFTYYTGDGQTLLDQAISATITDVDSTHFDNATIYVKIASGIETSEDTLSILNEGTGTGQIGFNGTHITYEGTQIGTASIDANGVDLTISLDATTPTDVSPTAVNHLLNALTYENTNTVNPSTASRVIDITLTESDSTVSNTASVTIFGGLILNGTAGDDALFGGDGADIIDGAGGNDSITGNGNNDLITAGNGDDDEQDTFIYTSATLDGKDILTGFDNLGTGTDHDTVNLDALFDNLGTATASRASAVVLTQDASNVVLTIDGVSDTVFSVTFTNSASNLVSDFNVSTDIQVGTL